MSEGSGYLDHLSSADIDELRRNSLTRIPKSIYLICATQRSGSTLLCDGLRATEIAGFPQEYFGADEENLTRWHEMLGVDNDADYLERALSAATTPNGVCGIKVFWNQARLLEKRLIKSLSNQLAEPPSETLIQLLNMRFGQCKFVWIRRENKIAQGISYLRARQSHIWAKRADSRKKGDFIKFDFQEIDRLARFLTASEQRWQVFFELNRIQPFIVDYEEFVPTYQETMKKLLDFIGATPIPLVIKNPTMQKQADKISKDWEKRYRSMKSDLKKPYAWL